ncbi:MAG: hypothetical protein M3Z41_02480 [Candidatus Eremiobacteraeota bacterium]|nr:hypothetical protein [Candidatus Eremiobacteraeota bacterium]
MQETKLGHPRTTIGARGQRGFAMAFVFVLVALLLLIAILVITGAFNANNQAQAVGIKYGVLNSAEAAANLALNRLEDNPSEPVGCVTGSLNGAAYRSCLGLNNLSGPSSGYPKTATDYANGAPLLVPPHSAYVYGEATNNGNRKVYVEAIAQPAPPLTMPPGAINAAQNINYLTLMLIKQDPLDLSHPNDADVHANNNVSIGSGQSPVQGLTFAVGSDLLKGSDSATHSGAPAVVFPNTAQIVQAGQNAKLIAQAGSTVSGATLSAGGTPTLTGNVYVTGDVNITSGTVTFAAGTDVYITGNLCISGTGTLMNNNGGQSMLVVGGVVASSGTGGYLIPLGNNAMLLALATDPGAMNPCGGSATEALSFSPASGLEAVGTAYAANGSLGVTGSGTVQGALDAGGNVDLGGGTGAGVQYDAKQAQTKLSTGTMTYTAYNQD